MGFGVDYDELGYDTSIVTEEDIFDTETELGEEIENLKLSPDVQAAKYRMLKSSLNLPHKLRMDISDESIVAIRDGLGYTYREIAKQYLVAIYTPMSVYGVKQARLAE